MLMDRSLTCCVVRDGLARHLVVNGKRLQGLETNIRGSNGKRPSHESEHVDMQCAAKAVGPKHQESRLAHGKLLMARLGACIHTIGKRQLQAL